jgi:hypothetical protein
MLEKLRPRSIYDVMAAIACLGVLAGGTAYAADTIGSSDVINESLLSEDVKNGEVKWTDLANNSVGSGKVIDETLASADIKNGEVGTDDVLNSSLTGTDVATGSLTGSDIATGGILGVDVGTDSLSGSDIIESSLDVRAMGCKIGLVQAFARVKGQSGIPATYTDSSTFVDTKNSCTGGTVQVRRQSEGVYYVRFNGLNAKLAVAISNSDGFGVDSAANDNVLSVNRITGGADEGSFRVEVEDVTGSGTDAEDGWFNIVVV